MTMENIYNNIKKIIRESTLEGTVCRLSKYITIVFICIFYEDKWLSLFNKYILGYFNISNEIWLALITLSSTYKCNFLGADNKQ